MTVKKYSVNHTSYYVRFNRENMKNRFLQNEDILKNSSGYIISDIGGHTSSSYNVNNFSMTAASAIVIGVA